MISDTQPPVLVFVSTAPGIRVASGNLALDEVALYYISTFIPVALLIAQQDQRSFA